MAAGDIYNISGNLYPARPALKMLGGAVDDGVQVDALVAAAATANHTSGTLTAWIMIPDNTGTYAIFGAGDASAVEYFDWKVVAGKLNFYGDIAANVAINVTSETTLVPYKWYHVAVVQDAVRVKMYINGVQDTLTETDISEATTVWFDVFNDIDGAHIGASDSVGGAAALTNEFKGLIGTFTMWSGLTTAGALTAAQIAADYTGNTPGAPYGRYTFTDSTLYLNQGSAAASDGSKVGDFTRVNSGSEFVARLQYEPAAPLVVADVCSNISITNGVGHALIVKAA